MHEIIICVYLLEAPHHAKKKNKKLSDTSSYPELWCQKAYVNP